MKPHFRKQLASMVMILLFALLAAWTFVGPWPLERHPFYEHAYTQRTLEQLRETPVRYGQGWYRGGAASVEITPPPGVPLGGYSAREPKANKGMRDPVFVKAISLSNGAVTVTLVSADILLPMPQLVRAVVEETGLPRETVYFMATHTHSGPGGYDQGFLNQFALGDFDAAYFSQLKDALAWAIRDSRSVMQPVTLKYIEQRPAHRALRGLIRNSFNPDEGSPGVLHVLQLLPHGSDAPLASLIGYDAHPTLLGKDNLKISGDYPGQLQWLLENEWGGVVMFAAGAMGGAKPGPKSAWDGLNVDSRIGLMAERIGEAYALLVEDPAAGRNTATWQSGHGPIGTLLLPVYLPSPTLHVTEKLRLSPFLGRLIHGPETYLQALKIGPLLLLGYPADYSIELARRIEQEVSGMGLHAWATGFNGDYIGYLMPLDRSVTPRYETREASLYGAWAGEYFHQLSLALARYLTSPRMASPKAGAPE